MDTIMVKYHSRKPRADSMWFVFQCILFSALLISTVQAQDAKPDDKATAKALLESYTREAPKALLDTKLGDATVELFLHGAWKSGIGLGVQSTVVGTSREYLQDYGMVPWYNIADLELALWIEQRYFFEATLHDTLDTSTFLLGYDYDAPIGLRRVLIGNKRIGTENKYKQIKSYPAVDGIPGIALAWKSPDMDWEAFVRLRSTQTVVQVFKGTSEQESQLTSTRAFVSGKAFQLPHQSIANFQLWKESKTGTLASDGRNYTLVQGDEIQSFDPASGTIMLSTPADGRLVASYTSGGSAWQNSIGTVPFYKFENVSGVIAPAFDQATVVFDPAAGSDFLTQVAEKFEFFYRNTGALTSPSSDSSSPLRVDIAGVPCLVLYRPGERSVFEDTSIYNLSAAGASALEPAEIILPDSSKSYLHAQNLETAFRLVSGKPGIDARWPLAFLSKDYARQIYALTETKNNLPLLRIQRSSSATRGIVLSQEALPDSIEVYRNGNKDSTFVYNEKAKSLTSQFPISQTDEIKVVYRVFQKGASDNTVQFFAGNKTDFSPTSSLETSLTSNITLQSQGYSTSEQTSPADIHLETAFSGKDSNLQVSAHLDAALTIPDISGLGRIRSFSETKYPLTLTTDNIFPASPLVQDLITPQPATARAALAFRDFSNKDGYYPYDSASAGTAIFPAATGQASGPSIANASSDPTGGKVVYLNFSMARTDETWAGFELRLNESERLAAAKAESLTFWLRGINLVQSCDFFVHAGNASEDLDSDGTLSTGSTTGSAGFPFRDQVRNVWLQAGTQASAGTQVFGEDRNKNGRLDRGEYLQKLDPETISDTGDSPSYPSISSGSSPPERLTIRMTPSIRAILKNAAVLRFSIQRIGGAVNSGTVIIGGLSFSGIQVAPSDASSIDTAIDSPAEIQAQETAALSSAFSSVKKLFSQSDNTLLRIKALSAGTLKLSIPIPSLIAGNYKKYALHIKPGTAAATQVVVRLKSPGNSIVLNHAPLTLTANTWNRLVLDHDTMQAKIFSSETSETASTKLDQPSNDRTITLIELEISGITKGDTILLDELIALDPYTRLQFGGTAGIQWSDPYMVDLAGFKLIGKPSIGLNLGGTYQTAADSTRFRTYTANTDAVSGFELLYTGIEAGIKTRSHSDGITTNTQVSGSHKLIFPNKGYSPLWVEDGFSQAEIRSDGFVHENSLFLQVPSVLSANASIASTAKINLLRRSWLGSLQGTFDPAFEPSLDFNMAMDSNQVHPITGLYDQDWLNSFYEPWYIDESQKISRQIQSKLGLKYLVPQHSLEFTTRYAHTRAQNPAFNQDQNLNWEIAFKDTNSAHSANWGLSYKRSGNLKSNPTMTGTVSDELGESGRVFVAFPEGIVGIPLAELFLGFPEMRQQTGISYLRSSPTLETYITRKPLFNMLDMIVPSRSKLTMIRINEATPISSSDVFGLGILLDSLAMNIFGRSGTQSSFAWYDQDTWKGSTNLAFSLESWGLVAYSIKNSLEVTLSGIADPVFYARWITKPMTMAGIREIPPPFSLTLPLQAIWSNSDLSGIQFSAGVRYNWAHEIDKEIDIRPDTAKRNPVFMSHAEEIKYTMRSTIATGINTRGTSGTSAQTIDSYSAGSLSSDGFMLEIIHTSVFSMPDFGYLSAGLRLGLKNNSPWQAAEEFKTSKVGIQLDIEARIVF